MSGYGLSVHRPSAPWQLGQSGRGSGSSRVPCRERVVRQELALSATAAAVTVSGTAAASRAVRARTVLSGSRPECLT